MTNYKEAVQALASSISSSRTTLSREKKLEIARGILAREGLETDRRDINIDFSDEKDFQIMRDYLGALQRARRAELGENIQSSIDNAKRLSDLRDELREDLSEAYDEDEELESIARRLQDKGLGKVAGKEEDQINELGASLQELARKGEEVDNLERTLEEIIREHGLDRDGLAHELEKRASKVGRLLESHSRDSEVDLDSIVDTIAGEQDLLEDAESRGKKSLEEDIARLKDLYGHKEAESAQLDNLEEELRQGKFDDAVSSLDLILADRKGVLRGGYSTLKELHKDLEDSLDIALGLKKLFGQLEIVESRDDINSDEFYDKLADRIGLPDSASAKQFVRRLEKDYGSMKDEIRKIEGLKEHNIERDKENYEKIKQIDKEDSELRKRASSPDAQRKLKTIHEKLQELGYELENEIEIETDGEASSDSGDSDTDDSDSKKPGPNPSGDPWIVSLSDVETNPDLFEFSLSLVNKTFEKSIAHKDDDGKLVWSGNNYKLIINGDLIQHGRHGEKEESIELIEKLKSLVSSAEDSSPAGSHPVQFTVGNHDVNLVFGKEVASFPRPEELNQIGGFPSTYQRWIRRGIVRMVVPGYNTTYVHAGQAHEWNSYEISRANEILENISGVDIPRLNSPDHSVLPKDQGLASTTFKELERMKEGLDHESPEFSNIGDLELAKLFSAGKTSLGDGSGKNKHAGMVWARPPVLKGGPEQVVGHTGKREPVRDGNLVIENTIRHRIPSVVIEKPGSITGLWMSMKKTGDGGAEWDKINQKSL